MYKEAVEKVVEVLRPMLGHNPRHDQANVMDKDLSCPYRAFKLTDPNKKHQKALPPSFYSTLLKTAKGRAQIVMAQLAVCVMFFCMRSCEYLVTPKQ